MSDIIKALKAGSTSKGNVIVVNRTFVDFTGSLEAAMMFGQLLYWDGKQVREDGFIAKSDQMWQDELCLSRYMVRKGREQLETMGVLETKIMRWDGAPTVHYRLKTESLEKAWAQFLEGESPPIVRYRTIDRAISNNPSSEIERSLTETTPKTTAETTTLQLFEAEQKQLKSNLANQKELRSAISVYMGSAHARLLDQAFIEVKDGVVRIQVAPMMAERLVRASLVNHMEVACNGYFEDFRELIIEEAGLVVAAKEEEG